MPVTLAGGGSHYVAAGEAHDLVAAAPLELASDVHVLPPWAI